MKYPRGIKELIQLQTPVYKFPVPNEWREWQADLLDYIRFDPDDREILWICDPVGCQGKTTIMRHILTNIGDSVVLSGKTTDMAFAYEGQRVCMFDVARSEREFMEHFYVFAEKLKGGVIFSNKYESGMKTFRPPHVIFFANFEPDRSKWTEDRLKMWEISRLPTFTPVTIFENNKFVKKMIKDE